MEAGKGGKVKFCKCGCGAPTKPVPQTDSRRGRKKGDYYDFIKGHENRGRTKKRPVFLPKLCKCGCGQVTEKYTKTRRGHTVGDYRDYVLGHNSRVAPPCDKGGVLKRDGYVYLLMPGDPNATLNERYVKRSRFIMEQILERPLLPTEIVHHINGIKSDD